MEYLVMAILLFLFLMAIPHWVWTIIGYIIFFGGILGAVILIILIVGSLSKSRRGSRVDIGTGISSAHDSGSYYPDSGSSTISPSENEVNPLFEAKKIDKAILSNDKILRDDAGRKIGKLEKAIFSSDQIIRDSGARKVGRIEQSVWDKDKQIIKGSDGKKEGEIKTDIWGDRIIVNKDGKKVGKIEKNIWGETVIKKK